MLSIDEAFEQILKCVTPLAPVEIPLSEALGRTLASDVVAPLDSPPFDKSLMDGYAVRTADLGAATAFRVLETVTAGQVPQFGLGPGDAIQIMTGAPLPSGADAVVKVEDSLREGNQVRFRVTDLRPGANLIRQGTSLRRGVAALTAGMILNGSRIGALAELGAALVRVYPRPTVAVLATGDELVPVNQEPGPGQIRNSNEAMLMAQVQAAGARAVALGIARDEREVLRAKIETGLAADVLVLSGGVSAGTLDLVPSELAAAGVEEVFHKVEMKPGKPLWFGQRTTDAGVQSVFGLPGNPVSSLVCFEVFVRTALRRLQGIDAARPQPIPAQLNHAHSARADRPTFHPAQLTWTSEGPRVSLTPWHGSSDLSGTVAANAMAFLPGIARQYSVGDSLDVFPW